MENLTTTPGFNLGGIADIKLAPIEWITNLPDEEDLTSEISYPLSFVIGHTWISIKPEHDSTACDVAYKGARAGDYFELKLETTLNLIELQKIKRLQEMIFYKHALMLTDNNGLTLIIGNQYHGVKLTYEAIVNPTADGKTFFKLMMNYEAETGLRIYNP